MAAQLAFIGGKCTQFGCHCCIYQESSSKWSKGKCQTCNHSQNQHKSTHQINTALQPLQQHENVSNNWTCESCTFSNVIKSSKCCICHSPNPNQQNNSSLYVKCTECESRILITEYESHLLMHQLSNNNNNINKQNDELVYLQCTECNKQILATEFDSHLLIHELSKQQSQSDQSTTIPCDQCNAQIPIKQYDVHRSSHNNKNKELMYVKCTESSCNQQILASELDSHLLMHQLSKPSRPSQSNHPELIPCEYDKCNLKIAAKEYTAHIAEHKNNDNKLVYITCTKASCKEQQILASEYESHLLLHQLSEPAKPSQPQFILIPCEYASCNLKIPSNEYQSHVNAHKIDTENKQQQKDEVCYITCDFPSCDYKIPFDKYEEHRSSHNNILVKCDHPSCNQQIPFQQYQSHQEMHRKEEEKTTCIECDYRGCGKLIPIKEYQSHQASHNNQKLEERNVNLHQQLTAMADLQQQLEAKNVNAAQEAQQLKDKLKDYEKEQKENKQNDWLQKKEKEAMQTGKIIRCKLKQKRNLDEDTADSHFRRCESQFMRSCRNLGGVGNGFNKTIAEVEYIINPTLIKKFETKKNALMAKNNCDESKLNIILAWHGTKSGNLNNIVENNFSLEKLGSHTGNKGAYGCGIYFSEFANISQAYGDGLLLCKIMLGRQYSMNTGNVQIGRALEPGYDSHVVVNNNNNTNNQYGQEVVIFDVDQILPCYIVRY